MMDDNLSGNRLKEIEAKLLDQEAKLLAQEHRFFKVIGNYFVQREKWEKGDPRRIAATKALVYTLFFSPTTVAATGGIIAMISLFFLWRQTTVMTEQNEKVAQQNELLREQNSQQQEQFSNQRITDLTKILYDTLTSTSTSKLKAEALVEYIELKRSMGVTGFIDLREVDLRKTLLSNYQFDSIEFSYSNLNGIMLKDVVFRQCKFREVSIKNSTLIGTTFYECNMSDADFSSDIPDTDWYDPQFDLRFYSGGTVMISSSFPKSMMLGVDFTRSHIDNSDLTGTSGMIIHEAALHGTKMYANDFLSTDGIPYGITCIDQSIIDTLIQKADYERMVPGVMVTEYGPEDVFVDTTLRQEDFEMIFDSSCDL